VAEAGWEPITRAISSNPKVHLECFGNQYLTAFNDSQQPQRVTITTAWDIQGRSTDLVTGRAVAWRNKSTALTLDAEGVAVLELH